jgi:hypothetical protein
MSFVAVRRRQYRQQYRPALGLPDPGQLIGGGSDGGSGSSISNIIGSIGKVASGIFSSVSAGKGAPPAAAASTVGPLAGASTGTIVGVGLGFTALILVLASGLGRGSR